MSEELGGKLDADIAARIRNLRLVTGISQVELASLAGVHRTVVAKAESSGGCRPSTLKRIGKALGVTYSWLNRSFLGSSLMRFDHSSTAQWFATKPSFVSKKGIASHENLRSEAERVRLGSLRLANAFVRPLNVELPGGRLRSLVVETYQKEQDPVVDPGQMFLYVLEGAIRLVVGDETVELFANDAVSYWSDSPNLYEPIAHNGTSHAKVLEVFVHLSAEEIGIRDLFRTSEKD